VLALVPLLPSSDDASNNVRRGRSSSKADSSCGFTTATTTAGNGIFLPNRRDFLLSLTVPSIVFVDSNTAKADDVIAGASYDAIIIGSGLAGLVSALTILDRGGRVAILEKELILGGNSKKASSGINGLSRYAPPGDSVDLFEKDTYASHHQPSERSKRLIDTLVTNSESALQWLDKRLRVDITQVAQLGGHSHPRTHRPARGMIGATLMLALFEQLKFYEKRGRATILTGSKAKSLITAQSKGDGYDDDTVVVRGVQFERKNDDNNGYQDPQAAVYAPRTIIASGGFAANKQLLHAYCPHLANLPTTSGLWATGDGILLATDVGAAMEDMSKVQIHPTGWVDPANSQSQSKILAAEVLRGVGGILLDQSGQR